MAKETLEVGKKVSKIHHVRKKIGHHLSKLHGGLRRNKTERVAPREFPLIDARARHRILAALSYFHIFVVFPMLFGRDNAFVSYHAKQGMILLVVWVLVPFAFWYPILGWVVLAFAIVELIIGVIRALRHKENALPLLGRFA